MTTITLPADLAEQLARQAEAQRRSVEGLAIAYLVAAVREDEARIEAAPRAPIDEDPELLALVARIRATPPNPDSVIPARGDLANVLRSLEAIDDPNYDLDTEIAALDAAEAELKALDRANDIAEGRG